jgi:hypothetical protein
LGAVCHDVSKQKEEPTMRALTILAIVGSALAACTPRSEIEAKLKTQASADLMCQEAAIAVDETDPNHGVWTAIGCDDDQSYVYICRYFGCDFVQGDPKTSRALLARPMVWRQSRK